MIRVTVDSNEAPVDEESQLLKETEREREGKGSVMKPICVSLAANNMLVINMVHSLCNPNCPHIAI